MEQDDTRFHHTIQNHAQFKMHELFVSGIFHLTFSDHNWPQVNEDMESKPADKQGTNVIYDKSKSQDETLYLDKSWLRHAKVPAMMVPWLTVL